MLGECLTTAQINSIQVPSSNTLQYTIARHTIKLCKTKICSANALQKLFCEQVLLPQGKLTLTNMLYWTTLQTPKTTTPTAAAARIKYRVNFFPFIFILDSGKKTATIMREIQLNCENPSLLMEVRFKLGKITAHPTESTAERISPTTTGRIPYNTPRTYLLVLNF